MKKLKNCPRCDGPVSLVVCDDEGNIHDEDYEQRPYSGLQFGLHHAEGTRTCPVAIENGELLGQYLYGTREEAVTAWNTRKEPDHAEH